MANVVCAGCHGLMAEGEHVRCRELRPSMCIEDGRLLTGERGVLVMHRRGGVVYHETRDGDLVRCWYYGPGD